MTTPIVRGVPHDRREEARAARRRSRGKSVLAAAFLSMTAPATGAEPPEVRLARDGAGRRVDVLVGDRPFTAYVYPTRLKKPVLYPLRTPLGTAVTRGFPLDPVPGERVDHPHHVGLWLNYGDVDGVDYWNHSDALSPEESSRMGSIVHRSIVRAEGGAGRGELEVLADWVRSDGTRILEEKTVFVFHAGAEARLVDRSTTLTARARRVVFGDSKEGLLGLRVTRALEHPSVKPEIFTDAGGRPSAVAVLDNAGVTGLYRSSEGLEGQAVWGTRGRWVSLSGRIGTETVTVSILDHPRNVGYPTHWHARGYGLFAANPLGRRAFREDAPERREVLEAGESLVLRYRVVLRSRATSADEAEADHARFLREVP